MTFLKSHRTRILAIALTLLLIAAGALFLARTHDSRTGVVAGAYRSLTTTPPATAEEIVKSALAAYDADKILAYTNPIYNFGFLYPDDFKITYPEDTLEQLFVGKDGTTIQIYLMPFDEEAVITPERIKKDLPDMRLDNARRIYLGKGPTDALAFETTDEAGVRTAEVWFARAGMLYQVRAYPEAAPLLDRLLTTWQWNQ